jgi:MFS family permease
MGTGTGMGKAGASKWAVLLLSCLVTLGSYYSFDFPSVLHNQLRRHFQFQDEGKFEFYFSLLYSLYSMPNMVIPIFGGILCDLLGNNRVMVGCATLVMIGNVLLLIACWRVDLFTLEAGRFIFGLGAETLQVCANTIIAKWFVGQELAFALGINLSACKLGGVLTDWMSPSIAKSYGVVFASGVVTLLCLLCYLLTFVLVFYDSEDESSDAPESSNLITVTDKNKSYQSIPNIDPDVSENSHIDGGIELGTINSLEVPKQKIDATDTNHRAYSFGQFSMSTWIVFLITFIMYGIFVPFNNISNAVLLEVFFNESNAVQLREDEVYAAR